VETSIDQINKATVLETLHYQTNPLVDAKKGKPGSIVSLTPYRLIPRLDSRRGKTGNPQ
jgi:hypothetical protein